jgi:hypothetical protein
MIPLSKKALERVQNGGVSRALRTGGSTNPFKVAAKEAFDAAQSGDFESFFAAFRSAIDIRMNSSAEDDIEPVEELEVEEEGDEELEDTGEEPEDEPTIYDVEDESGGEE